MGKRTLTIYCIKMGKKTDNERIVNALSNRFNGSSKRFRRFE